MNAALPIHALARAFPAQSPDIYEGMKASIDAIGQLQPIAVWQGHVIDGAHRYRACLELGIEPEYNYLADDTDPETGLRTQVLTPDRPRRVAVVAKNG